MVLDKASIDCSTVNPKIATGSMGKVSPSAPDSSYSPVQLLALAIRKRRSLIEQKQKDMRRELLHTGVIQLLCKSLGESRAAAKRRRRRRHQKRRRSDVMEGDENCCGEKGQPQNFPDKFGYVDSAIQTHNVTATCGNHKQSNDDLIFDASPRKSGNEMNRGKDDGIKRFCALVRCSVRQNSVPFDVFDGTSEEDGLSAH